LKAEQEDETIPEVMEHAFSELKTRSAESAGPKKGRAREAHLKPEKQLTVKDVERKFELANLSEDGPEAKLDIATGKVSVNVQHPLYAAARKRKCLEYHILKSIIVVLAAHTSRNISEFLEKYNALSRTDEIPNFRKKIR
ncbi:MAG: hypothetical protein IMZ53_15695, partial [Thermoplasmata archaeon]|nr:hypothetical protein [Thermoplasmata archaeon]